MVVSKALARASADMILHKTIINTNSFYGLVPRRLCAQAQILSHTEIYCFDCLAPRRQYLIQKIIHTNSFHGHIQGACARASADSISYRKL